MTKLLAYSDFATVPLAILACFAIVLASGPSLLGLILLPTGAIAWTLVEYCVPATAPFVLGVLAAYLVFILLHHGEHHDWPLSRGALSGLAAAHERHHHGGGWYGVTTTLWDRLFGTAL